MHQAASVSLGYDRAVINVAACINLDTLYDFHIFNSNQGLGLGKQSLRAFEEYLQEKGFKDIRLRVADDNARARHVYETSGFGVTGANMSKSITD
ncbi:TPA: GNAT family N-acetyltransferase [Enterobacter mori]|nr:GNAT family N-acetyltransferase [Enterobacter mori]